MDKKWTTLTGLFLVMALVPGFSRSMNVLYVDLIEIFSASHAEAALVQSCVVGSFGISGVFTGYFTNWLGERRAGLFGASISSISLALSYFANSITVLTAILTIGVGIGSSTIYIAAPVAARHCFGNKTKSMAVSFVMFAGGIGGIWLPYFISYLLHEYDIRGALLICGGVCANGIAACALIGAHDEQESPMENDVNGACNRDHQSSQIGEIEHGLDAEQKKENVAVGADQNANDNKYYKSSMLKNVPFLMVTFGIGTSMAALYAVLIIMTDHVQMLGYHASDGIMLVTVMNMINLVSRLLPGFLKQIPRISILFIPVLMTFIGGACVIMLPLFTNFAILFVLFCVSCGLSMGCLNSARPLCIMKLVGIRQFSPGIGISLAIGGSGVVVAGPITGLIKDVYGSYDIAFYMCGGVLLVNCLILSIALLYNKRQKIPIRHPDLEIDMNVN